LIKVHNGFGGDVNHKDPSSTKGGCRHKHSWWHGIPLKPILVVQNRSLTVICLQVDPFEYEGVYPPEVPELLKKWAGDVSHWAWQDREEAHVAAVVGAIEYVCRHEEEKGEQGVLPAAVAWFWRDDHLVV
jgi:hypothetical protein